VDAENIIDTSSAGSSQTQAIIYLATGAVDEPLPEHRKLARANAPCGICFADAVFPAEEIFLPKGRQK